MLGLESSSRGAGWVLAEATQARNRFALAPMEGVSDAVARALLSNLGELDLCVTEFFRVTDRPISPRIFLHHCPELRAGSRTPSGTPVLVQLLGSDPDAMAESAERAIELGALGIDLNFGCPARRVNGRDGGASLLREPHRIEKIVRAVRKTVPSNRPVSAKVRLGWEKPDDIVGITQAAEAGGAAFVTIHGRTKVQLYKPSADWTRIGMARRAVKIPIVANGDLFTPKHVTQCREITGCHAFMIGRGAFRTPNIFRWVRGIDSAPWTGVQAAELLRLFAKQFLAHRPLRHPERATLARIKQWVRYLADGNESMARCFAELKRKQGLSEALAELDHWFPRNMRQNVAEGSNPAEELTRGLCC